MEFFRKYATFIVCTMWVFVACRLGFNNHKSGSKPNVAEIPENLRIMREMRLHPLLQLIVVCESDAIQYYRDGTVLRGIVNSNDKGIAQINKVHWDKARKLGYDLDDTKGNLGFAAYLFNREGSKPWNNSKKRCWGKKSYSTASNR